MGIPSYYKKLVDSVPGLVKNSVRGNIHSFYLDFNCLIYHCLRRPSMIAYKGPEHKEEYEEHLLREIVAYVKQLVAYVKPEHLVYLAVDGVVPMAKIRQQRLRRFKSVVVANFEESIGKRDGLSWDTNAITPGTLFMKKLHDRLHSMCVQQSIEGGLIWKVSSAAEPGEGEHKIMDWLRKHKEQNYGPFQNNIVIYGLDADLIILSMLIQKHLPTNCNISLFRESMEFGSVVYNSHNSESYHYLDINALTTEILKYKSPWVSNQQALHDYCYSMSLLGNDFLPHGFTLHLQEHGHDRLLDMLRHVWDTTKKSLVNEETFQWDYDQLQYAFSWLAQQEEIWFFKFIKKALKDRYMPFVPKTGEPWEQEYETWNRTPNRLCDVQICYDHERDVLRNNWVHVYYSRYVGTSDSTNVLQNYLYGLQWINNYYEGQAVCKSWYFPWYVPPLWSSLAKERVNRHHVPVIYEKPIQDYEQLMMVLPQKSWNLVPAQYKNVPKRAPQYWPSKFNYFMAGRKFMWNSEAMIPILSVHRLRSLLR